MALDWERNGPLDTWEAQAPEGKYLCMRTHLDVAVLYLNGAELRRSASDGSHLPNREYAEQHHAALQAAPRDGKQGMLEGYREIRHIATEPQK